MVKLAALLVAFATILSANPVIAVALSEIQTAPDSLERIEFHNYEGVNGLNLSGAELVTRAGTAVIDSGVVIYPETSYVVIDSTNTTGVFSLGDDTDDVRLVMHGTTLFRLRYPANPFRSYSSSWAPPPGTSASILQWTESGSDDWIYTWYIDATPTFGEPNDDTFGGITGYVYGDDSVPVDGATIRMTAAQGTVQMLSGEVGLWPPGYFAQTPTGPGEFVLTAEYPGYLPYTYPETIQLEPNNGRGVKVYLRRPGAVEEPAKSMTVPQVRQRGRTLVLDADRPGTAFVSVYDNLGRVRASEKVALVMGESELALPSLASGVYFANCRLGERTLNAKFVLY
jgi:hypothetical protein